MYKQQFPMFNSIWPKIGLGPFLYSGTQFYVAILSLCRFGKIYFVNLVSGLMLMRCIPGLSLFGLYLLAILRASCLFCAGVLCHFEIYPWLDVVFPAHIGPMSSCDTCMAVGSESWATFWGGERDHSFRIYADCPV